MHRRYSVVSKFRKPLSLDGLYYSHGLMCASYPRTVIALVAFVVIICSLPFFVTPSGDLNKPKYWRSPWLNYRIQATPQMGKGEELEWIINKPSQFSGRTPSWFVGLPVAVVQQLYVNLEINCSTMEKLCDKSYYSNSKLVSAQLLSRMEHVINTCHPVIHPAATNLTRTLSFHDPSTPLPSPRPPNGILSPMLDSFRIKWEEKMALSYHSIKELIYGGFWEHGYYSGDTRQRDHTPSPQAPSSKAHKQHTLGLTLLLHSRGKEDFRQLVQCVEEVKDLWPDLEEKDGSLRFMKHFYYEPEWSLLDFAPLMGVYSIVILYISFSVGKIDLVKSKIGLGFTAFVTLVAGLTMSLGICTFFGLSISLSGSEIYPYVVIVMGLENILIIVKAVMSTPEELDVKFRIAVGLSKEGWAITRNLVTLALMTSMGIVFFNYVLKEFCILALVGLLCDAFLQLVFFPTVLSIDLRRLELTDLSSGPIPIPANADKPQCRPRCPSSLQAATPMRWRSKRIKFIYFLARTRIVSRLLMLSFIILLSALFVKTDTFHNLLGYFHPNLETTPTLHPPGTVEAVPGATGFTFLADTPTESSARHQEGTGDTMSNELLSTLDKSSLSISRRREDGFEVKCENGELCWRPMVTTHWPRLLNYTGISMDGRFLTLLPPIYLDFFVGFTPASLPPPFKPFFFMRIVNHSFFIRVSSIVGLIAVLGCYLYRLVRSSRFRHQRYMESVRLRGYNRMVCLKGHSQDVDYLCVDGGLMVTTGLDGDIRVWDVNPMKRRCARVISRSELCREPPTEVPSSSHRPAAEGCEATDAITSIKQTGPGFSRRGSKCSSVSDYYDYHSNRPGHSSRLSSVSDIFSSEERASLTHDSSRHLPVGFRGTSTPPSPVTSAVPMKLTTDMSGVHPSQHALRSNPLSAHRRGTSAHAQNAPQLATSAEATSVGAVGTRTTGYAVRGTLPPPIETHPVSAQNVPHTSRPSEPHPSFMHAAQYSRNNSPNLSRPHPNHTSQSSLPPNLTLHEYPVHIPSKPHELSQPHPHNSEASQPHPQEPHHGGVSLNSQNSATFSLSNVSTQQDSAPLEPPRTCVHLQLEPDVPTSSGTTVSTVLSSGAAWSDAKHFKDSNPGGLIAMTTVARATNATAGDQPGQRLLQSHSHPNLVAHMEPNPLPYPGACSQSSTSIPIVSPSLHMSHRSSLSSVVPPGDLPDVRVDVLPPTSGSAVRKMRELGHSRHLSLGRSAGGTSRKRPTHSRNRSLGSINFSQAPPLSTLNSTPGSYTNLSMMSNASICGSEVNFLTPHDLAHMPDPDKGYDFAQHFNLFSQYTFNMALQYCMSEQENKKRLPVVPPVWCMAFWNRVVAVGCGNGQLEAWNADTGSLIFNLNIGSAGVGSITMSPSGIITGQMDGTLSLISYSGLLYHCVPAHDKAIGVLHWYGNKIITGGYDNAVKVHCISGSGNSLVCVNSVHVHEGNITAVTVVESQLKLGCVSGCSKGLVIHWDINSGNCICEFGLYSSPVLQLEPTISNVVGLFGEGCVRVWEAVAGYLVHTIQLDGVCQDLAVLSSQHIAVCLESSVEVYDLESGKPHSEKQLETKRGGMSLVRHVQALDGASVVCSSGKDIYIVPCDLKLKND